MPGQPLDRARAGLEFLTAWTELQSDRTRPIAAATEVVAEALRQHGPESAPELLIGLLDVAGLMLTRAALANSQNYTAVLRSNALAVATGLSPA